MRMQGTQNGENPSQTTSMVPAREALPTLLESKSNRLPTIAQVKRLHGPLALRNLLGVSAATMLLLLRHKGCRVIHRQTIYTWERAEREPRNLPKGYWHKYYMPDDVVASYHAVITEFVLWVTRGAYTARVTGKRIWHVQLRRVA